jgi:hypothetical protein
VTRAGRSRLRNELRRLGLVVPDVALGPDEVPFALAFDAPGSRAVACGLEFLTVVVVPEGFGCASRGA